MMEEKKRGSDDNWVESVDVAKGRAATSEAGGDRDLGRRQPQPKERWMRLPKQKAGLK